MSPAGIMLVYIDYVAIELLNFIMSGQD